MKTIVLTAAAAKDLDALPEQERGQVSDGLISYATTGVGDVSQLKGREGFRLWIGRYRVILDEDRTTILAIYVGKREITTYR